MTPTNAKFPLASTLRSRINRLAHSRALQHEVHLRAVLVAQVQTARDCGASFAELSGMVAELKAAP